MNERIPFESCPAPSLGVLYEITSLQSAGVNVVEDDVNEVGLSNRFREFNSSFCKSFLASFRDIF